MKLIIDKDKCFMSGECYYNHPELFKKDEDGFPMVLINDINDDETRRHAEEAIVVCPAVAISKQE